MGINVQILHFFYSIATCTPQKGNLFETEMLSYLFFLREVVSRQHVSQHVEEDQQPDRVPMEDGQDAEMGQDDAEAGIVRLGRRVRRPNTRYLSSRWTR